MIDSTRAEDIVITCDLTGQLEEDWVWFDSMYAFAVQIAQKQNQTQHVRIGETQRTKKKMVFRVDVLEDGDR